MRTDLKLGIVLGIIVVICAVVLLVTRQDAQEAPPVVAPEPESTVIETEVVEESPVDEALAEVEVPAAVEEVQEVVAEVVEPCVVEEVEAVVEEADQGGVIMPSLLPEPEPCEVEQAEAIVEEEVAEAVYPEEDDPCEPRYHEVAQGDTLTKISALYYYGSGRFANVIYQANRDVISDPDALQVGWRLRIPWPSEVEDYE